MCKQIQLVIKSEKNYTRHEFISKSPEKIGDEVLGSWLPSIFLPLLSIICCIQMRKNHFNPHDPMAIVSCIFRKNSLKHWDITGKKFDLSLRFHVKK